MAQITKLYRAEFHYENVPKFLEKKMADLFMQNYNKAANIFNRNIAEINKAWDQTGKPGFFGEYIEDVNPEYVQFISIGLQPLFDELNATLSVFNYYELDEYGQIVGYSPALKGSRIWVVFRPV